MKIIVVFSTLVNVLLFWNQVFSQTCPAGDFRSINGRHYFLSNNQVNANTASSICSSLNGYLVSFADSQLERQARELISQKYTAGLQDVWGFFSGDYKNTFYSESSTPPLSSDTIWSRDSDLGKFKMYSSSTRDYNQRYIFCYNHADDKGMYVSTSSCVSPFDSFTLYGGTQSSPRRIPLYNYYNKNIASRLSRTDGSFLSPLLYPFNTPGSTVYFPDIHIFIGARSIAGQTEWYWSNPANTATTMFDSAPRDQCRQQAIRFRYYDDEWVYAIEPCAGSRSYYVCEFPLSPEVDPIDCDENSLNVSWNVQDDLPQSSTDLIMQIYLDGKLIYEANVVDRYYIITGLVPDTQYDIRVDMKKRSCPNFIVSRTIQAQPKSRITKPVQEARVRNSTNSSNSSCVIEWEHDRSQYPSVVYEITIGDSNSSIPTMVNITSQNITEVSFQYAIDLNSYSEGSNLTFQINATGCYGGSIYTKIDGNCFVEMLPDSDSNSDSEQTEGSSHFPDLWIIVVAVVICVVLISISIAIYFRCHATKSSKKQINLPREENQEPSPEIENPPRSPTFVMESRPKQVASLPATQPQNVYENERPLPTIENPVRSATIVPENCQKQEASLGAAQPVEPYVVMLSYNADSKENGAKCGSVLFENTKKQELGSGENQQNVYEFI